MKHLKWFLWISALFMVSCSASHTTAAAPTTTASATSTTTAAVSIATTGAVPTSTPTVAPLRALAVAQVDWKSVTLPGSVCGATQPIHLSAGGAIVSSSRFPGTPQVRVGLGEVIYGHLKTASGDEAAANIWCENGSGTADGQLANSWVIYSGDMGTLAVLATLVPQQPANSNLPHVPYFDSGPAGIVIHPGMITVKEFWYRPNDPTCCPSIQATTQWGYSNGTLHPTSTTHN